MKRTGFTLVSVVLCLSQSLADSQLFKCSGEDGKVSFSDLPCAASQKSSKIKVPALPDQQPPTPPLLSKDASDHEKARKQKHEQTKESQNRIAEASADLRRIRAANADPAKCAQARGRMQLIQQRDPIAYRASLDYYEFQHKESLYCGN